jgi:glycosyltransferase involved in cell wall biosynthesis
MPRIIASSPEPVRLVLTTEIEAGRIYGGYDCTEASKLIDVLGILDSIDMLGSVKYTQLGELYAACDLFVFPSYAESFGHPMLEAMAAGLPVIAADLPVHREVCGDAALYFGVFDEVALAAAALRIFADSALSLDLSRRGRERSATFSWDRHVALLTELIDRAIAERDASGRRIPASQTRATDVPR